MADAIYCVQCGQQISRDLAILDTFCSEKCYKEWLEEGGYAD